MLGERRNSAGIITVDDVNTSRENSICASIGRILNLGHPARTGRNIFMRSTQRSAVSAIFACSILIFCAAILVRSGASSAQEKAAATKKSASSGGGIADGYRFNTLGVAYMNQQRPADAQKYFEQSLEADSKFAVARLNSDGSLDNTFAPVASRPSTSTLLTIPPMA